MVEWQPPVTIPLASGLAAKADKRALQPPGLAVCRNAQFDELGGIQKRLPYAAMEAISSLTDIRRIVANGDELLCFTKDKLLSWSSVQGTWVEKATYLAPKLTERSVFVNPSEQACCDRAELNGVTFFAWEETSGPTSFDTRVMVAAKDSATGAVLLAPQLVSTGTRPRLTVHTNKVLLTLVVQDGILLEYHLLAAALDPANLTQVTLVPVLEVPATSSFDYDIAARSGADPVVVCSTLGSSYHIGTISEALTGSFVSKERSSAAIAVAVAPNGTHVQVVRALPFPGTVVGDYLSIAGPFLDVRVDQEIGTHKFPSQDVNQIAAAYSSVPDSGGQYRCYVFWSADEDPTDFFSCESNWIDTGGSTGAKAALAHNLGVASRAFEHDGHVYVWLAFASETSFSGVLSEGLRVTLQNTYFLYRDDGLLVAKAAATRAGGFSKRRGHLPNVQRNDNTYTWCGVERRVIPVGLGAGKGYSARAPREIAVEFDSDEARRTARLGETLYIAGGEVLQYDGESLVECGFHIYPWKFSGIEIESASGEIEGGKYTYKVTWRSDNAKGERDRSTTATYGQVEITAPPNSIQIPFWSALNFTHKSNIAVEVWRTLKNPPLDAPFYLATSQDPSQIGVTNGYVKNDKTAESLPPFEDGLSDEDLSTKEINPENGGVLENLAPPAASIVAATQDRLFLAGLSDNPYRLIYSKRRGNAEVAAFHDALTVEVPPEGGAITALGFFQGILFVFCKRAIYSLPGEGFDNLGLGQNYGPVRVLSTDVGAVNAESICLAPMGFVFKSNKGWYLLSGEQTPQYIGRQVADFDSERVVAVHVMESQHQIRAVTENRILVWDYLVNEWSEWEESGCVSATLWDGEHVIATSTNVKKQQTSHSDTNTNYSLDVETAWFKPQGVSGYFRLRRIMPLGEFRSRHDLRIRVAKDYLEDATGNPAWFDDTYYQVEPEVVGGPLAVLHNPSQQKMSAVKIRLTDYTRGSDTAMAGEGLKLTALSFEWAPKKGVFRARAVPRR